MWLCIRSTKRNLFYLTADDDKVLRFNMRISSKFVSTFVHCLAQTRAQEGEGGDPVPRISRRYFGGNRVQWASILAEITTDAFFIAECGCKLFGQRTRFSVCVIGLENTVSKKIPDKIGFAERWTNNFKKSYGNRFIILQNGFGVFLYN